MLHVKGSLYVGGDGFLTCKGALFRILIFSEAEEYRGAEFKPTIGSFVRPLGELHFRNPHRFHPTYFFGVNRAAERVLGTLNLSKLAGYFLQGRMVKSGASLTNVNQVFLLIVESQHQ